MSVDLRRFTYPMEPLRQQRRWKLERLLLKLGRLQKEIHQAEEDLAPLKTLHAEVSQSVAPGQQAHIHPDRHRRHLGWLVQLRTRILDGQTRVDSLKAAQRELQKTCLAEQSRVDVLDRHFQESLDAFAQEEHGRLATEMDRDWLARISTPSRSMDAGGGA